MSGNKPKFKLDPEIDSDGCNLISRVSCVLLNKGMDKEFNAIHQEATVVGYDYYKCLKIILKYVELER